MSTYEAFLAEKVNFDRTFGHDVSPDAVNPILLPHQRDIVTWAVKGGRRAIFAAFGLGKSVMQLETLRLILEEGGPGRALIICPLGVRQEFVRDAHMLGIEVRFVRRSDEVDGPGIYLTNYESVRDGRLDPSLFTAVSLDEASVLRSFGSKTYQTFLTLFDDVPFRFVATATPSPNRYKELIHYAGFLGVMDTGQALTRFFQRDSTQANNLTLYPHKTIEFHLWLSTWATFLQRPSDLCRCECHQSRNHSKASASEGSSPSNGSPDQGAQEDGSADVTAGVPLSRDRASSKQAEPEVVDASDRATTARGPAPTGSGGAWSDAAPDQSTRTGPTTGAAESLSANAGEGPSPHSAKTWETRRSASLSNESTTVEDTSPAIADGPAGETKRETHDAHGSSRTTVANSQSQRGPKSSGRTTSPSIPVSSNSGGPQSAHSLTSCDGRCDDGYVLPDLDLRFHELDTDVSGIEVDPDGQAHLFRGASMGVSAAAREKRDTLAARVEKAAQLVAESPGDHFILWHDLEDERRALKRAIPEAVEVYGSLDLDVREQRIIDFSEGRTRILATKPELSGSGCNFQRHCHRAIFVGVGFKFNDFVQAVHRIHRFLQTEQVRIDIIHAASEREVVRTLMAKWQAHKELTERMSEIIREHGLSKTDVAAALARSMGVDRIEASGDGWLVANNDCVDETARMDADSVDLIVTSIPFANHYEYTPSYNDFGHTDDNDHFWAQMDFLTPQLLRVLRPGRVYACHVKDRILFGNVTGAGAPTVSPFHAEALMHGRRHGFDYLGMITVVTDVVRENNQTYRLGWSEQCKDGTKMGVGSPEYILLFRKPQTDRTRGYADSPVTKSKADYTRARWQVDAHAFWRSSGDRPLTPEDFAGLGPEAVASLFTETSLRQVYDYESHVRIGAYLDGRGSLPSTFMTLAPGSWHSEVWTDVNRMLTLNTEQSRRAQAMHVCPLQFDIVDRLIERYSNPGDLVFDPFGGLFTVPVRALKAGRQGRGVELNTGYFLDGVKYLEAQERQQAMPSLFDLDVSA